MLYETDTPRQVKSATLLHQLLLKSVKQHIAWDLTVQHDTGAVLSATRVSTGSYTNTAKQHSELKHVVSIPLNCVKHTLEALQSWNMAKSM